MKKVLVITYYWPPHAGVGVQRWLKFVKYLPEYGWEPIVFTPENASFDLKDNALNNEIPASIEVIRFPIWEPFSIFDRLTGGKNKKNVQQGLVLEKARKTWKDKFAVFVRGNFFIPDPRRFWVKPSVRYLEEFVISNNIDAVVTTGPPHSIHLIGLGLKQKTGIKWLADFRDPWSHWDLLDKLRTSTLARKMHRSYESKVLKNADRVITVSKDLAIDLKDLGANNCLVITNGVDIEQIPTDFDETEAVDKFRISHIGLLNEMRDPELLWDVLIEMAELDDQFAADLELNLAGIVSESILEKLRQSPLKSVLNFKSYIPHEQVFKELQRSALLLVILNKTDNAHWIIPGKMYEYLVAKRRIIMIGPENSNAADILRETNAGVVCNFSDKEKLHSAINAAYVAYKKGSVVNQAVGVKQFSRKKLTSDLSEILNDI